MESEELSGTATVRIVRTHHAATSDMSDTAVQPCQTRAESAEGGQLSVG